MTGRRTSGRVNPTSTTRPIHHVMHTCRISLAGPLHVGKES